MAVTVTVTISGAEESGAESESGEEAEFGRHQARVCHREHRADPTAGRDDVGANTGGSFIRNGGGTAHEHGERKSGNAEEPVPCELHRDSSQGRFTLRRTLKEKSGQHSDSPLIRVSEHLGMSFKILSLSTSSFYVRSHSRTAIPTSSLLWNVPTATCCFSGPYKGSVAGDTS